MHTIHILWVGLKPFIQCRCNYRTVHNLAFDFAQAHYGWKQEPPIDEDSHSRRRNCLGHIMLCVIELNNPLPEI